MSERTVVLLGDLAATNGPAAEVVRKVGMVPLGVSDWEKEREVFRRPGIIGVVFSAEMKGYEELCVELRSELAGDDLPLIAVVPKRWDPQLERLFMFSIDDYVSSEDFESLEPKLLALGRGNPWINLTPSSGRVVIADADRARRALYGRMLRRKGLGVEFAGTKEEVAKAAANEEVRMILVGAELPPMGAAAAIADCQKGGGRLASLPWIVDGTSEQLEKLEENTAAGATLRMFNRDDPPEAVLFLINELMAPPPDDVRRSPRLLYGGPATFRVVGSRHLVPAFTFNINRTGVFLRTLVPPPRDSELVMDIRPPHGEGRARAYGKVVWRKECSQQGGPVVPAGMGVIYTNVPIADRAALDTGYDALLGAAPGRRSTRLEGLVEPRPEASSDAQPNEIEEVAGESE